LLFLFPIKHTLCASFRQAIYLAWDNYLIPVPKENINNLIEFLQAVYMFGMTVRKDAMMNLLDAILEQGHYPLSLC